MVNNMKKDLAYYMSLPYQEVIEADPDGGFVGHITDLPGCITQAETRQELLDMLADAKAAWLEAALEEHITIPEPAHKEDYSGRFNLRLPKSLHKELAMTAKAEGVSLNQLATILIAKGLRIAVSRHNFPKEVSHGQTY